MGKAKEVLYCNDRYKGSLSEDVCDTLEQLIELDSQNGCVPDLRHIIYNIQNSDVIDIIEEMGYTGSGIMPDFKRTYGELRDEQTIGVALLYYAGNALLGDSVGMGKTVEIAGLHNLLSAQYEKEGHNFKMLVLTEKSLSTQVRFELVKFTGDYVELIPSGLAMDMDKFFNRYSIDSEFPCSLVGTHALLSTASFVSWLEQCATYGEGFPFDMLVIDESSILGNNKSQITQNFKVLSKYFSRIVFLNATPFETQLGIFFTQLNLLDPAMMPTKTNFEKEYCIYDYRGMFPKLTGRYKNAAQFKRLVGYRYFARTRRSKGAVMEDCSGGVILSDLSKAQKELLKISQLKRMIYDCPSHIDESIEFNMENVPKLRSLNELLKKECVDADSILIFVHFKEAQKCLSDWLSSQGISNRVLNGETGSTDREQIISGFKNHDYRVLITNVQKGLNFGSCNYCIFYSVDPNPSKMIQFEGRTTRDFDIIGKHVYVLCSMGQEYKNLNAVVRQRAKATAEMSTTDISVIMSILLGD